MRALVIDDSSTTRMILRRMLGEIGFDDISDATNGQEGLDSLIAGPTPEVVLVDWKMPVMDGYEFVKAVRAKPEYDNTPLMLVTTETELDRIVAALEAGANEYVMKPFTRDVIEEKLALLGLESH